MGIELNSLCVGCLLEKHIQNARSLGSEEQALVFTKAIMQLFLEADPEDNSAIMGQRINQLYMTHYGLPQDRFTQEKEASNRFVKQRLEKIRAQIQKQEDPVLAGLQYAILGNYIDFSALGKTVSFQQLEQMLLQPERFAIDPQTYSDFCRDLKQARSLLILTDNAGEIGFDRLLAEQIKAHYPQINITFCVRGMPAHNDATREDAQMMEIPFPVIDSGSDIGGIVEKYSNEQTRKALRESDVILSKGMGNTECLYGCGYNVYYAFLVKCPRFIQHFNKPKMTAMFLRDPKAD